MSVQSSLLVLLTTDFKPMTGGIAEYLHGLWNQVSSSEPTIVYSTVQDDGLSDRYGYGLNRLPKLPERQLGNQFGDRFSLSRKLNTVKYFHSSDAYSKNLIRQVSSHTSLSKTEIFIGHWNINTHFWCKNLREMGKSYSLFAHGLELVSPYYGNLPKWRQEDFMGAKSIITCSLGTAKLVAQKGITNVPTYVVHPGINSIDFNSQLVIEAKGVQIKKQLNIPDDSKILLTVCRLVPRKGIDLVLDSLPILLRRDPNLHYLIAGEGSYKNDLIHKAKSLNIENNVHFLGNVDDSYKSSLFSICDIFVMPNRLLNGLDWEGFGITFLEAALAGKPSIGGNNGGVPDAIEDGRTGLLVNTDNYQETCQAIEKLLCDADLRLSLGAFASKNVKSKFTWKNSALNFLNSFKVAE